MKKMRKLKEMSQLINVREFKKQENSENKRIQKTRELKNKGIQKTKECIKQENTLKI